MTENRYAPEGSLLTTKENEAYTASLEGLERAMQEGRIVEGNACMCDCKTMCLTVDFGGIFGYIPREEAVYNPDGSEVKDIAIITRVGKPIAVKVTAIERDGGGISVRLSRRAAQAEYMQAFFRERRVGDILPVKVTHLEPFGAFVDIGCGVVSLITVDMISVSRISHPSDRLTPGEMIYAVIRTMSPEGGRVYMTLRELLGTWEENARRFAPAQTVPGIVRSVEPYGIFVELMPNLAGLAEHCPGVGVGDRCAVYIKSILPEKMKIKLVLIDSFKDSRPAPLNYFVDVRKTGHLSAWQYSPADAVKRIETVFDTV